MSEEGKAPVEGQAPEIEVEVVETPEADEIESEAGGESQEAPLSEIEQRAAASGWMPLKDWVAAGYEESDWRSAREFNDRGELIGSIKTLNKKVEQYDKALKAFATHHNKVFEAAHKKALEDLKAHKKLAIREGDHELAEEIAEEIEHEKQEFQRQARELTQPVRQQTPNQAEAMAEMQAWQARNQWYAKDEDLREAANGFMLAYIQKEKAKGNMPTRIEVLEHAARKVKRLKPDSEPARREPPAMGVRGKAPSKGGKVSIQLTPEEKQVMKALVDSGEMTREQYLKEIATIRGDK